MNNIKYNDTLEAPEIGNIVTEAYALGQWTDGCIYVLPTDIEAFGEKAEKAFAQLLGRKSKNLLLNHYEMEVAEALPMLDNHPIIDEAIRERKCNLALPLFTPDFSEKQYLMVRSEGNDLVSELGQMVYASERASRKSMEGLVFKYAVDKTDKFYDAVKEAPQSDGLLKNQIIQKAAQFVVSGGMIIGMAPTLPNLRGVLDFKGAVTYQKSKEMWDRFIENVIKYKKNQDPKAAAEIALVLKSLDVETLLYILSKLPKLQLEMIDKATNPQKLAEASRLTVEIRHVGKIDHKLRTDGRYRLFLKNEKEERQVHFSYRESIVIYMIYLIDKVKHDEVDSLKIEKFKKTFIDLFELVYGPDEAASRFDSLVKHKDKNGPRQAQIKHCYSDIRTSIGNVCEMMHELSTPFVLKTPHDHLSVLKDRIILPDEMKEMEN